MAVHNPREFDGCCPKCGTTRIDWLDKIRNDEGERILKYFCDRCQVVIEVNDETDEVEFYEDNT